MKDSLGYNGVWVLLVAGLGIGGAILGSYLSNFVESQMLGLMFLLLGLISGASAGIGLHKMIFNKRG